MHINPIINQAGEVEKAGCVVFNDRNEILLVTNRRDGTWGLPKGHAEAGETSLQVALRETREETGYEVEAIRPVGDVTYVSQVTQRPVRVHFFLARPLTHHDEADEQWHWVDLERALTLVPENLKVVITEAKA